jgi:FtsP/CotA-like multicopper oxidase with cupredoxin domain
MDGAALPAIVRWRRHEDDAETRRVYDDQAWPPLIAGVPADADEGPPGGNAPGARKLDFLGVNDYGFDHGAVWYRGHFVAGGAEHAFRLRGKAGRGGACAVWLNGLYLGNATADDDGRIAVTLAIPRTALRRKADNVLSVLFENMGHNEDFGHDVSRAQERGMLDALLEPAEKIDWHILGNGEYNTDELRGPLNAGGLAGEIAGWHLPSYSDAAWPVTTLPDRTTRAGVTWYRAHVTLHAPADGETSVAVRVGDGPANHYRASIYVNGWLMGHYVSGPGAQTIFPIPSGVLSPTGDNTIAIAAWSLDGRSGLGSVSLVTAGGVDDPHVALPDIAEVRAAHGVARLELDAVGATKGNRPHFVFDGVEAAPTIRARPGDTIAVTLRNRLPHSNETANDVNLHFHGLDVSPGDEVLETLARPGQTLRYRVQVPVAQPPGLYWYHPHSHGETYWQVTSGMAGAIVIEGLQRLVPGLAAMRERTILIRDVQDVPNIMSIPWYARPHTRGRKGVDIDDNSGANDPCSAEAGLHATVNGLFQPLIPIAPGEQQFFRVVNASASRVLDLAIDDERLGVVAIDGYPVGYGAGNPAVAWSDHLVVPPAGRVEFIATGQSQPAVLRTRCYDSGTAGDRDPDAVLAILQPAAPRANEDPSPSAPVRASGARSISQAPPARRRVVRLSEDANGFYINGKAFSMAGMNAATPAFVARAGTLEEWTIFNDTDEVHDFHIHQVHFLVESVDGAPLLPRVWRDNVLVPVQKHRGTRRTPGVAKILVDFRNPGIRGTFVFHCHMLDHEDGGMMAVIKVI